MCNVRRNGAPIFIVLALSAALLHPAHAADAKADKKKSQAAYQQGVLADKAGQRADAIAAYSAAIAADASNGDAWRARGKDYLAAGDKAKALADFEKAIEKALALAKSKDAVYLPGWCGPASDD